MAYRTIGRGTRISEYILVDKLGQGGFGEVWKAEHAQIPGKYVAIKIPMKPDSMDQIRKEAVFQHQLDHPNIVRTIGLDTENDPPYFVMEYVEGRNLREFMQSEGILPPPYAIDIAVQVLEALAYAHTRGIIHKDIKPENILVEKRRIKVAQDHKALLHYVKITDLGLGNFPEKTQQEMVLSENTKTGGMRQLSGTLFYMAPEQMLSSRTADSQSDIYSVGVVLYEMLTGELPLGMDLPSELNPVVTPELDQICKRALSINREHRYQGAREMIGDLHRAKEAFLLRLVASGAPAGQLVNHEVKALKPAPAPVVKAGKSRGSPLGKVFEWSLLGFVALLFTLSAFAYMKSRKSDKVVKSEPVTAPGNVVSGPVAIEDLLANAEATLDGRRLERGIKEITLAFEAHEISVTRDFHEPRQVLLEPKLVEGRRYFQMVDGKTRALMGRVEFDKGGAIGAIEQFRQKGSLKIDSNVKGAMIWFNGEKVGVTPHPALNNIDAGVYKLKLEANGYKDLEMDVIVRAGEPVSHVLQMEATGTDTTPVDGTFHPVAITSRPAGATVYINEENKGVTPFDLRIPNGMYRLRLELKYHEVFEINNFKVGGTKAIEVPLAKIHGRVSLESDPKGATVLLDGNDVGVTPLVVSLEGGLHSAEFVLPGFYKGEGKFEVLGRDQFVPVKINLQKVPPARLTVECDIQGLEVFVDDVLQKSGPGTAIAVEAGKHRVRVMHVEREVTLEAGNEPKVRFELKDLGMVSVPAGKFLYGAPDRERMPRQIKQQEETLAAFYIDQCEVTNEQYGVFLEWLKRTDEAARHAKCDPNEGRVKNHTPRYWDNAEFNQAKRPVVGIDYYDAVAFAAWAGKRLPSEREWEKAARGIDGRAYPWGDAWQPNENRLNWGDIRGETDGHVKIAPVGSYPDGKSPFECLDMAGNVQEWTSELWDDRGHHRVVKGGSFNSKMWRLWERDFQAQNQSSCKDLGFRCVIQAPK